MLSTTWYNKVPNALLMRRRYGGFISVGVKG